MDARQLQFFVTVVETGSFSEAAKACYVTQPAISAAIRKLETELNVKLLERHPRKIVLTEFGQSLYESALGVAADIQLARSNIEALRDPGRGTVRIGIDQTVAPNVITDVASALLAEFPHMRIEITTGLARYFEKSILHGELDFIVAQPPPPAHRSPELDYSPLFDEAVFPVANSGHELAGKANVRDSDFVAQPWCVLRWISGALWMPEFFSLLKAVPPEPRVQSNALLLMKQLLLTTDVMALFPQRLVAEDLASGRLVRIGNKRHQIVTTRYLISRRSRHHSPALLAFLRELDALTGKFGRTAG